MRRQGLNLTWFVRKKPTVLWKIINLYLKFYYYSYSKNNKENQALSKNKKIVNNIKGNMRYLVTNFLGC